MRIPKIGLALGGGVARGLAHIGVLRGLEELDIKPNYIAGTSSGSIIGALYAAGLSVQSIVDLAGRTSWNNLIHLVVPRLSLIGTKKMEEYLSTILEDRTFHQLEIPFTALATDLLSAKRYVFREGDLAKAIVASCSIPGIFPPVEHRGRLLVDGGLVENVPVQSVREMGAELIIAVDLYASHAEMIRPNSIFMVLLRSYEIMQGNHGQPNDTLPADICITPDLSGESLVDLNNHAEYIKSGYNAVKLKQNEILKLIRSQDETNH